MHLWGNAGERRSLCPPATYSDGSRNLPFARYGDFSTAATPYNVHMYTLLARRQVMSTMAIGGFDSTSQDLRVKVRSVPEPRCAWLTWTSSAANVRGRTGWCSGTSRGTYAKRRQALPVSYLDSRLKSQNALRALQPIKASGDWDGPCPASREAINLKLRIFIHQS